MVVAEAEERKRNEDDPLSDRERDVLRLLALGHTNQEISDKLYISVRTAETHRAHIMQKLRSPPAPSSSAMRLSTAFGRRLVAELRPRIRPAAHRTATSS